MPAPSAFPQSAPDFEPVDAADSATLEPQRAGLWNIDISLFWRTFFLLALLLTGTTLVWMQMLRVLEFRPRAEQTAQQIASLINVSRTALTHTDPAARASLAKALADREAVRIRPLEPGDRYEPLNNDLLGRRLGAELVQRLGPGAVAAKSVNGMPGLWVGFNIDGAPNWLQLDRAQLTTVDGRIWLVWMIITGVLSLAGAAMIARYINRPLQELLTATSRVRDGNFDACRLNESAVTSEIRKVNIGFNRMVQRLGKLEHDRAVMLAGISHDLRTPLARLRLETEMSVTSADARELMVADLTQIDAIIGKFLDYARLDQMKLSTVLLNDVIDACANAARKAADLRLRIQLPERLFVLGDEVELGRVINNLIENARRYGRTPGTSVALIDIAAKARDEWVLLKVRDHGNGVRPEHLPELTKPFFRGEAARTSATGTGLGLAIVRQSVERMGGQFVLANAKSGGLSAHIRLPRDVRSTVAQMLR